MWSPLTHLSPDCLGRGEQTATEQSTVNPPLLCWAEAAGFQSIWRRSSWAILQLKESVFSFSLFLSSRPLDFKAYMHTIVILYRVLLWHLSQSLALMNQFQPSARLKWVWLCCFFTLWPISETSQLHWHQQTEIQTIHVPETLKWSASL